MNAIDTNVVAYLFDSTAPGKQTRAQGLLDELTLNPSETIWLWQVAVEFLACLRRAANKGMVRREDVPGSFRDLLQLFALKLPSAQILERSMSLHERYSLSHWDSLLIAACEDAGVTCLFSEDMQSGAAYNGVTIVNPFT